MPWLRSRTERSSGITTWAIEWREGGRNGKVRARQLGAVTEKEAQFELAAMQAGKSTRRAKQTITAKRAVADYLKHLKASGRRQGTIDHDEDKLDPLVDEWSETPLSSFRNPSSIVRDQFPYRVRNALGVYRRFVAWCDVAGYACGDFVAGFKPPRARPLEHREALSAEQARKLLDAARGHYLEVPVAVALFSGLSRADLRAITWKEVDLKAGLITRPRHKTGTRLRLPISAPLQEILKRHRKRTGRVCRCLPESDSSLYKALHCLCDRAGVPRGGWHDLRHTAATLLAAAGTDLLSVQWTTQWRSRGLLGQPVGRRGAGRTSGSAGCEFGSRRRLRHPRRCADASPADAGHAVRRPDFDLAGSGHRDWKYRRGLAPRPPRAGFAAPGFRAAHNRWMDAGRALSGSLRRPFCRHSFLGQCRRAGCPSRGGGPSAGV